MHTRLQLSHPALPARSAADAPTPNRAPLVLLLSLLLAMLFSTACRTFDVHSDWDESVSFEGYKRYGWLEPPAAEGADPFADNTLLRKRIRAAVDANLTGRGFAVVEDPADADFLVTYGVVLDEKLRVNGSGASFGGGYGYGRWPVGFGGYSGAANVSDYQEATLVLDFLEPESKELLWRGWGSGFIQTRDRDRGRERFEEGIKAVLDRFPPKAKGS